MDIIWRATTSCLMLTVILGLVVRHADMVCVYNSPQLLIPLHQSFEVVMVLTNNNNWSLNFWPLQHPRVTWLPFKTFSACFPQPKSMRKLAEKVTSCSLPASLYSHTSCNRPELPNIYFGGHCNFSFSCSWAWLEWFSSLKFSGIFIKYSRFLL